MYLSTGSVKIPPCLLSLWISADKPRTSAEVGVLLDIKLGTVREWKRRCMWDGPEGQDRPCNDDMDTD